MSIAVGQKIRAADLTVEHNADGTHKQAAGTHLSHVDFSDIGSNSHPQIDTFPPTRATFLHDESTVTVGNALYLIIDAAQVMAAYWYQNTSADGDTFTQTFFLKAGNYTLYALGVTNTGQGKADWYVDDVLQISGQDWYSAAITRNVVKTGSITVVGDGAHILKCVVNGKNPSSSSYSIALTKMWIK